MTGKKGPAGSIHSMIDQLVADGFDEISIFHFMDRKDISLVADYFELVCYPAGTVLVREGERVAYLGIVAGGKLEASHKPTIGERKITIAHLENGSHIGTISFPGGRPAMAEVVAEEETHLLVLSEKRFNTFAAQYPAEAVKLLKGIVEVLTIRLEHAIDRVILFF